MFTSSIKQAAGLEPKITTPDERQTYDLLFKHNEQSLLQLHDQRLNNIGALTYNQDTCERIFALLENALITSENEWQTIYKAVLLVHTCIMFGSEIAVDKCIGLGPALYRLRDYNSAIHQKAGVLFNFSGGQDHGGPVRIISFPHHFSFFCFFCSQYY